MIALFPHFKYSLTKCFYVDKWESVADVALQCFLDELKTTLVQE